MAGSAGKEKEPRNPFWYILGITITAVAGIIVSLIYTDNIPPGLVAILRPTPTSTPSMVLIADFETEQTSLSSESIYRLDRWNDEYCDYDDSQGMLRLGVSDNTKLRICDYGIADKSTRSFESLGSLEAGIGFSGTMVAANSIDEYSFAVLGMVSNFDQGVELHVQCGVENDGDKLVATLRAYLQGPKSAVECEQPMMGDLCWLYGSKFVALEPGESYEFKLVAGPTENNEFQCFANTKQARFRFDRANRAPEEYALTGRIFDRYVSTTYTPGRTGVYLIDDIYESR